MERGNHTVTSRLQSKPEKWCGSGGRGLGGCGDSDPGFPFSWPVTLKVGLLLGAIIGWTSGVRNGSGDSLSTVKSFQAVGRVKAVCVKKVQSPMWRESRRFFSFSFSQELL